MATLDVLASPEAVLSELSAFQSTAAPAGRLWRGVELTVGFLGLAISLPLLVLCAVVIKLSSRGPALFTQTRVGKDGKLFKMYKLRTMRNNCERNGSVWAGDDDPRVVWSCRWMRLSHVDELPQLLNVIKGDMALIGPRPERADILADLEHLYPNIRQRLMVLPGITGLAQIRWGYDTTPARFRRKLQADLEYIRSRNWRLDAGILLRTLPKFFDRNAK